jgi:hypothetical protein
MKYFFISFILLLSAASYFIYVWRDSFWIRGVGTSCYRVGEVLTIIGREYRILKIDRKKGNIKLRRIK